MITPARTFAALRHRDYRLFSLGQVISLSGNWAYNVGESWLVYKLTGSTLALGAYTVVALLPVVPVSIFGSPLIDRVAKRKLVLGSQLALSLTLLTITWVAWTGHLQLWQLILTRCVIGIIGSVDQPARQAFISELVPRDELPNAIALNTFFFNVSRIVGPLVAGMAITATGEAAACFLINGLAFLPFAAGVALIRRRDSAKRDLAARRTGSALHGFAYLRRNPVLVWLLALMSISNLLLLSFVPLMPAIAKDLFAADAQQLSILVTCVGVGATLGSLTLAHVQSRYLVACLTANLVAFPLTILGLTGAPTLIVAIPVAVVVGFNMAWQQTIFVTLVQLFVREDMRGRTTSTYLALSLGTQQGGGLQAGFLAEFLGVGAALRIGAVASLLCTAVALWRRPAALVLAPLGRPTLLPEVPPPPQPSASSGAVANPRPGSSRGTALTIRGGLNDLGLVPIAQFIAAARGSGRLQLMDGTHRGDIEFADGHLVQARFENERGLAALVAILLGLGHSTFAFETTPPPAEHDLRLTADALQSYVALLGPGHGPPLSAVPRVSLDTSTAENREAELLRLDRASLALLAAVDGKRTTREVIGRSPVGRGLVKLGRLAELDLIRFEAPRPVLALSHGLDGQLASEPPIARARAITLTPASAQLPRPDLGAFARRSSRAYAQGRSRGRAVRRRALAIGVPVVLLMLLGASALNVPASGGPAGPTGVGPALSRDRQRSGGPAPQEGSDRAQPDSSALKQALATASAASTPEPALLGASAMGAPSARILADIRFATQPQGWADNPPYADWADGAYRLSAQSDGGFVSVGAPLGQPVADVTVRASLREVGGRAGAEYGVILRDQALGPRGATEQTGRFYVFEVNDRGEVSIRRRDNDRWTDLVAWRHSDAVRPGDATNELAARAERDRLTLSVNGVDVAAGVDATLVAGGVGVFVGGSHSQVALDHYSIELPG